MEPTRIRWIDTVKGIGILLVVVGHTIAGLQSNEGIETPAIWQPVFDWIYSFHMPLFFFLSGLWIERQVRSLTWRPFIVRALRTLAYPYVVWSLLQTTLMIVFNGAANGPATLSDFSRIIYHPPMQFWFLYVLLMAQTVYYGLRRCRLPIAGVTAVAIAWHFIPNDFEFHWGPYYQLKTYLAYFAIGALFQSADGAEFIKRQSPKLALAGGALGWMFLGFSYAMAGIHPIARMTIALVGIISAVGIAQGLSLGFVVRVFSRLGRDSLAIYVAHTICSAAARVVLIRLGTTDSSLHLLIGLLAGVALPVAMTELCKLTGFPYAFQWPKKSEVLPASDLNADVIYRQDQGHQQPVPPDHQSEPGALQERDG